MNPTILEILKYPHPILFSECGDVDTVDDNIKQLINNMLYTMYNSGGIGLSANQVGVTKSIFVMDTTPDNSKPRVFINPRILAFGDTIERQKEGCLSFPGIFSYVKRPIYTIFDALNENGETISGELHGIDAICFQHEYDHLNGITFYDHLSPVQKNLIKKKIQSLKQK